MLFFARRIGKVKRPETLLLIAVAILAGSFILTACARRDGAVEGTISGADPSAAQIQVVIYDLQRADEVTGMDVFQKGAILQKALVGEDGGFAFTLPPQEYILQVWVDGIEMVSRMIEIKSGRTTTLDLEVTSPSP